jgi:3-hydroxyisobutyrate dehydrogenase-like beta-hydroxyacid dehydrogenase
LARDRIVCFDDPGVAGRDREGEHMKVGVVGLGQMGMPMLERLRAAGHDVTFRARRAEVIEHATRAGAVAADGFGDRDVVIVCVYSDEQVREVGPEVLASMEAGSVLVNHTTGRPSTATWLQDAAAPRDVRVLDAALSGSPDSITAGQLTLLVGGDPAVLEQARPALAAYSDPIIHVGVLGDGQRIKLVNNALLGAHVRLVEDAERVARALGVDPSTALDAIQHCSGDSRALRMVAAVGGSARLNELGGRFIAKDLEVVKEVAREEGVALGRLDPAVDRLADRQAIEELKARYCRLIDTKDWVAFRDLFTDDCQHFLPQESEQPFVTNEPYFAQMETLLTPGVTTHQCHTPEITFLSETEAEGTWAMHDYVQVEPPTSDRVSIMGWGHYFETYRKCDDGKWRISSKRNVRLRLDQVPWTLPA